MTVDQLAGKFIELYWRQARIFPLRRTTDDVILRQNFGQQAEVITTLRELQPKYESRLPTLRSNPTAWRRARRRVGGTIKKMPLWKLQTVAGCPVEFMYRNTPGADRIVLLPGVADCFREFHGLVIELVRAGWVRFVRRHNESVRETLELYTFLFGSERASLESFARVLAEVDGTRCFYCDKSIRAAPQVDHFIPWSRYPNDLGHNLVLAHGSCNGRKSDYLAGEEHLAHWAERNGAKGAVLVEAFQAAGLPHDGAASVRIAHWAYGHLAATEGQVWIRGRELRPLGSGWAAMLQGR